MEHLFVQFAHHHGLDLGQEFGGNQGIDAECLCEGQGRAHVPSQNCAGDDPQLPTKTADQIPDLPAVLRLRSVQPCGAVRAVALAALEGLAGRAVSVAPAEGPVGEGAETFFSASRINPRATYWVWKASNTGQISSNASMPSGLTGTILPASSPTPSQSSTARRATALAMARASSSWLAPSGKASWPDRPGRNHQCCGQRGHQKTQAGGEVQPFRRGGQVQTDHQ